MDRILTRRASSATLVIAPVAPPVRRNSYFDFESDSEDELDDGIDKRFINREEIVVDAIELKFFKAQNRDRYKEEKMVSRRAGEGIIDNRRWWKLVTLVDTSSSSLL
jgi:hypothetical protein